MKLLSVTTTLSPGSAELIRMTGTVEKQSGERFDIWFEVPIGLGDQLSNSGNPWLVAMLPYGMETGETIVCDIPSDAALVENLNGVIATWCQWYPHLIAPKIEAPLSAFELRHGTGDRTAGFFSGGVDSWFTVLRHLPELLPGAIGNLDELITVHGFDIPIESVASFEQLRETLANAAKKVGKEMVVVKTNLRRPGSLWASAWGWLTNGAGLATVALLLEGKFGQVIIGSSYPYGNLGPWGSHPMVDPLFSTKHLSIKHDGASFDRVEKTRLVASFEYALTSLHVCWKGQAQTNCGVCSKCVRTLATLELLQQNAPDNLFLEKFDPVRLRQLFIATSQDEIFIKEIYVHSNELGNHLIRDCAAQAIRRSTRLRRLFAVVDSVPVLWRIGPALRRQFLH